VTGDFDEMYSQYKELFEKLDETKSIREQRELFRQLAKLLAKMADGSGRRSRVTQGKSSAGP
jgi:predicted nuclease with TOPRIM domain